MNAIVARRGKLEFDNLDWQTGYVPMKAYATSKLANVAFAVELARRAQGLLMSVAVHPGTALTGLQQHASRIAQAIASLILQPLIGHSPADAARPTLYAATSRHVATGGFYAPTGRFELRGPPGSVALPKAVSDARLRDRLWTISEETHECSLRFRGRSTCVG